MLKDLKGYDAAIILALSPFAKEPTLERYAYNERDSVQADNKGYVKTHEVIEPKGPASRATDIDLASLCQSLIANGYGAAMGLDPGRFVANECYYRALKGKKALLIHVPLNEDYPESESADVATMSADAPNLSCRTALCQTTCSVPPHSEKTKRRMMCAIFNSRPLPGFLMRPDGHYGN